MRPLRPRALAAALAGALIACGGGDGGSELSPAAQRGRQAYRNVCIACHHGDPARDGALGPAIAGASRELLFARVIEGTYPEGYEPKRPSQAMPRYPYVEDQIDDLAAYLAEVGASDAAPE